MDSATNATQRFYISEVSDSKYFLPSDEEERERLAFQNETVIRLFGDKKILVPVVLKDGNSILDSGTGSGHWVLSVSKDVSTTINLRGIDISPHIFPPPQTLPPNVSYLTSSITSLPDDWTNKFSLVHQRFMCGGLNSEQWQTALSEIHRVLVPGGWIQFLEPHHILQSPSEALRNHKAFKMKNEFCFKNRIVINAFTFLEDWLQNAGFVNVRVLEKRDLPLGSWGGDIGVAGSTVMSRFLRGMKQPILLERGFGMVKTGDEYDAAVDDLMQLCETTSETFYQLWIFAAQKSQS